jgi:hypothetical protein
MAKPHLLALRLAGLAAEAVVAGILGIGFWLVVPV